MNVPLGGFCIIFGTYMYIRLYTTYRAMKRLKKEGFDLSDKRGVLV